LLFYGFILKKIYENKNLSALLMLFLYGLIAFESFQMDKMQSPIWEKVWDSLFE
jgi:hypothetical protein